jgi:hypothetical protein
MKKLIIIFAFICTNNVFSQNKFIAYQYYIQQNGTKFWTPLFIDKPKNGFKIDTNYHLDSLLYTSPFYYYNMKTWNKYTKRSEYTLGLNDDRVDAFWQIERGKRYGNARKSVRKAKFHRKKVDRRKNKLILSDVSSS